MLLDSVEDVHAVLAVNHVHCQAPLAKAARAPDPVQVGLIVWVPVLVHGKVKVDDDRNLFDINTCVKERWRGFRTGDKNHCQASEADTHQLQVEEESVQAGSGIRGHGARSRTRREKQNLGRC